MKKPTHASFTIFFDDGTSQGVDFKPWIICERNWPTPKTTEALKIGLTVIANEIDRAADAGILDLSDIRK